MNERELAVRTVQFLSVDAVEQAKSGHPGAPMALAGIAVDLFARYLRYVPEEPSWTNRDRFVLSCGHASMLAYSLLHLTGYDVTLDDLRSFRQWGAKTAGHPEVGQTPGIETTTGPLGQGIANAVGMALAERMLGARVNAGDALIDYRVFVLASDGDLMEGVCYEAAALAGHLGLGNLKVVYDDNRITIDGGTDLAWSEDVRGRFTAAGWYVDAADGHDSASFCAAMDRCLAVTDRPTLLIARTTIGLGAPTKEGTSAAHGAPLGAAEALGAKRAAGWPEQPFYVPDEARAHFAPRVAANRDELAKWRAAQAALPPERAEQLSTLLTRATPDDLLERLLAAAPGVADATRSLASVIQQEAARLVPSLMAGSADLASSTKAVIKGTSDVRAGDYAGRNVHYGIREHAMGSVMNGLALSGAFIPVGSTFLIFGDYMRPAMRMAALMKQQVIYALSHDSIFLGEDGPTHQPIEQLWTMRLIPNLHVFRPADGVEAAVGWYHALTRTRGPTVLALSRQTLPVVPRPPETDPRSILQGAYVVSSDEGADLVLIATGSEVATAVSAAPLLREAGYAVRIVSAPCLELFAEQPEEVQQAVLPPGIRRVSIECGTTVPWRAWVGLDGVCIGLDRFGASAPAEVLAEKFGLEPEQVARRILAEL